MKKFGKVLIGCFVIIVIVAILGAVFGGVIINKLISGAIREKTGVNVNVNNINSGKLSYTDPKTGATLNIGDNKIPDNFPKDFPIYPNAVATSSLSANQSLKQGMWLTLTTKDDQTKVVAFYEKNLKDNGWSIQTTTGEASANNYLIGKDKLKGYLTISQSTDNSKITTILIILGQE